jgi:hypothetical protein
MFASLLRVVRIDDADLDKAPDLGAKYLNAMRRINATASTHSDKLGYCLIQKTTGYYIAISRLYVTHYVQARSIATA